MSSDCEKKLRTGFTTGAAAAAAVKGALQYLLTGHFPPKVNIPLLTGQIIAIHIHTCRAESESKAVCTVIKDAGDDPDITHKAEIGAVVEISDDFSDSTEIRITGGEGVGRVTKPGLEVAPGNAAINSGPQKMIQQAVTDVLNSHYRKALVSIEIFVPKGKDLAKKTLNARLGILDGISILGTTGLVRPMSHEAYIATIVSAMSVAHAAGLQQLILTTGRRSERFAQARWPQLPEEAFVQIGDFFQKSLQTASEKGFEKIRLAVFFGKALKMALGFPHTHAAKSELTLHRLSKWALEIIGNQEVAETISHANTARHAFEMISAQYPQLIAYVGKQMMASAKNFSSPSLYVQGMIFDFEGNPVYDSEKGEDLP
ncbi:MAG: cobalt-precorrin-5B (C(1))-methyltransferase CbiD [Desulfococcaceae bacterium]